MVEYGLLIAMVSVVALGGAGKATEDKFGVIASSMEGSTEDGSGESTSDENADIDEGGAPAESDDD